MKPLISGALMLLVSMSSFAQSGYQPFTVTSNPSSQELTILFSETTQGQHDPILVLRQVAAHGDGVVPALGTFISNTPVVKIPVTDSSTGAVDSVNIPPPNRVYGVMALDLIGTPSAYQALTGVAQTDTDADVRGEALKSLAISLYRRTIADSLSPDEQIVHIFLRDMDDTTFVETSSMRIGDIAREGLKNWMGVDFGEMLTDSLRVREEARLGMTLPQYREQWWQQNSANMVWNASSGHFEIKQ